MARLFVVLALLAFPCAAAASPVLLYDNGHVRRVDDPALPPADATNAGLDAPRACAGVPQTQGLSDLGSGHTARASVVSVSKALRRAYAHGDIDQTAFAGYRDVYSAAKHAWHRLSGNR